MYECVCAAWTSHRVATKVLLPSRKGRGHLPAIQRKRAECVLLCKKTCIPSSPFPGFLVLLLLFPLFFAVLEKYHLVSNTFFCRSFKSVSQSPRFTGFSSFHSWPSQLGIIVVVVVHVHIHTRSPQSA